MFMARHASTVLVPGLGIQINVSCVLYRAGLLLFNTAPSSPVLPGSSHSSPSEGSSSTKESSGL